MIGDYNLFPPNNEAKIPNKRQNDVINGLKFVENILYQNVRFFLGCETTYFGFAVIQNSFPTRHKDSVSRIHHSDALSTNQSIQFRFLAFDIKFSVSAKHMGIKRFCLYSTQHVLSPTNWAIFSFYFYVFFRAKSGQRPHSLIHFWSEH